MTTYIRSIGRAVWFLLTITCSMLLFSTGVIIFALGFLAVLCVSPALFTGWKLVGLSRRLLIGIGLVRKVPKYSTPSAKDVRTFLNRS